MRILALAGKVAVVSCAAVALAGCHKDSAAPDDESGALHDGGTLPAEAGTTTAEECGADTVDPFVISEENQLYSYNPPSNTFKAIGLLHCPTAGATPTSMAVDRKGIAWVRHTDGSIWKVNTRDLSCEATAFVVPTDGTFAKFGMGFATIGPGSTTEELFLSDSSGAGLAKLDTKTFKLTSIGVYKGALSGRSSELTGTGDGKLYGFFVTPPTQIAEITKDSAEVVAPKEVTNTYAGTAWAFSFYGGDFYVYTNSEGSGGLPRAGSGSDVTKFSPADGTATIIKPKIGFKIVGAGVSTCAPTTSAP